jgi:hypothetical protein
LHFSGGGLLLAALILVLACLAVQGCILFTDPVNAPPTVRILDPMGPVSKGTTTHFTAKVTDPDDGTFTLEWATQEGTCPTSFDGTAPAPIAKMGAAGDPSFDFTFPTGDVSSVCIWVKATDPHGATGVDARPFSASNRPPVAVIDVLEPTTQTSGGLFPLYSVFHLSAARSSDPDGDPIVMPEFRLDRFPQAAMPTPQLEPCPGKQPTDLVTCLDVGGFAGTYVVTVSVSDGLVRSDLATATLVVDQDHPPCINATDPSTTASPLVLAPGEAKTFTVTEILDDGAPLPPPSDVVHGMPTFAWTLARNGAAPVTIPGYENVPSFTLSADAYGTNDTVTVGVKISDGVAMHLQPACDPRCPAGCPQTAEWKVMYR